MFNVTYSGMLELGPPTIEAKSGINSEVVLILMQYRTGVQPLVIQ